MSQTGTGTGSAAATPEYDEGWRDLTRKLQEGGSFSGMERDCAFLNTGGPRFANVSGSAGIDSPDDGRAVARVDWDHDGDLDLWVENRTGPQVRFLRNDAGTGNHFVELRLTGRRDGPHPCNRDGIGARVEVDAGGRRLVRSPRAGEGFLAQSSRWVHVGLGPLTRIDRVTVRWPGAAIEEFRGVSADGRFELVQGTGVATLAPKRAAASPLAAAVDEPAASEPARIPIAATATMPQLRYNDLEGHGVILGYPRGRPTLVNLFASYCKPCVRELKEFSAAAQRIRAADLRIVALSVEAQGEDSEAGGAAARALITALGFPFEAGLATPDVMEKLHVVQGVLFSLDRPLPLPTSILVDGDGRIAVIYKSPVEVDALLADVAALPSGRPALRAAAQPLPGRWISAPSGLDLRSDLAARYAEHKLYEAAAEAFRDLLRSDPDDASAHDGLGAALAKLGDANGALAELGEAVKRKPDDALARYNLGTTLIDLGRAGESIPHFVAAVRILPADPGTHENLAVALVTAGRAAEALPHFADALRLKPDFVAAHLNLGKALTGLGRAREAAAQYEAAVRLDPKQTEARLAWSAVLTAEGRHAEAAAQLAEAVRRSPGDALARQLYARSLATLGRTPLAIEQYRALLAMKPGDSRTEHRLAFLLATDPDPTVRDGAEAVRLAERAAEHTGGKVPEVLDTLAAAYAEAGRFDDAILASARAVAAAEAARKPELVKSFTERQSLYRAGKPLRRTAGAAAAP